LIHQQMVFPAEFAAISWVPASMLATSQCWHACSVDTGSVPHDLVMLAKAPQHRLMDTLPNACLHPHVKATPARHAAAAGEFTRQIFPGYSSLEDKQDSCQGCAIIDTRPPAFWRPAMGREMSCYKRPKVFG
jgi:hypothetical protein